MKTREVKLGEVANVKGGKRIPKGIGLINIPNGHPYIRVRDLNNKRLLELDNSYEYVDNETQKVISKYTVKTGDVVLSIVGTIGLVAIVGRTLDGANLTENCVKLSSFHGVNRDFLYYYLRSDCGQQEIRCGTVGAVQAKLPIKNIQNIAINLPDYTTQERIASLLLSIDRKIELNQKINDNLLRQAQALYKNRFIDLKPFNGEMPPDWQLGTVSEIIELHDSKRIPLSSRERANLTKIYPYYGATSVMDYVDSYLFDGIYLLLGEDGTVVDDKGFPILQYVEGKFWVNNHAHIITGKNGFTVETLYLLFSLTNVRSIVTGAVQPKISQANLNNVSVVIPSKAELSTFNSIVQPIFSQIRNLRAESDRLTATRDILLPRLMSGEIDATNIQL